MNYTELCNELKNPEYQGKSDQEAADMINAKTEVVRKPVDCGALKAYAIKEGFYADIEDGCIADSYEERNLCRNIKAWIDDIGQRLQTVNMDDSVTADMMNGLVALTVITAAQAQAMDDMANVTVKWTDLNDYPEIGIGLVQNARNING
jgi:hypothetical protein